MKNQVWQKVTLATLAEGHNLPANWAGELFKHYRCRKSCSFNL